MKNELSLREAVHRTDIHVELVPFLEARQILERVRKEFGFVDFSNEEIRDDVEVCEVVEFTGRRYSEEFLSLASDWGQVVVLDLEDDLAEPAATRVPASEVPGLVFELSAFEKVVVAQDWRSVLWETHHDVFMVWVKK